MALKFVNKTCDSTLNNLQMSSDTTNWKSQYQLQEVGYNPSIEQVS